MGSKFIVLDTEGVSNVAHGDNKVHGETSLFYDLGFIVADREGSIYEEHSFVNTDVFMQKDLMNSAYFAEKLPQYWAGMGSEWTPVTTKECWVAFKDACKRHGIKDVWAYNARYDEQSTNYTIRQASNGFCGFFLPWGTRFRDIWDFAGENVCNTKKFVKWAFDHGFTTASGNPSTSADTVAKYVKGDLSFNERHTALDDCKCELEILLANFKRHGKTPTSKGQGWRKPAKIAKEI